jgi:hypothetical protein
LNPRLLSLNKPDALLSHKAESHRIKSVMQVLIFKAARSITHVVQ